MVLETFKTCFAIFFACRERRRTLQEAKKKGERESFLQLLFKILFSKIYGQVYLLKKALNKNQSEIKAHISTFMTVQHLTSKRVLLAIQQPMN